jgi:hypothetical protein
VDEEGGGARKINQSHVSNKYQATKPQQALLPYQWPQQQRVWLVSLPPVSSAIQRLAESAPQ